MVSRFDPQQGTISIDNSDIRDWKKDYLREQIGVVSQEPILFATSIFENIRHGKPTATKEEVYKVAVAANAHDFISQFSDGYQTLVGERGVRLSGGQKQRVAIARGTPQKPQNINLG